MDILFAFIRGYLFFLIIRLIFNTFKVLTKGINQQGSNEDNGASKAFRNKWGEKLEKIEEELNASEMIKDEICDTYVPKNKAYIVVKDDVRHYFCSWECREKFVKSYKQLFQ